MMDSLARDADRLDRRRRIVADCRAAGTEDLRLLADVIDRQAAGDDISVDDFLCWGWAARLEARDGIIREARQRFFPDEPRWTAAQKIARLARTLRRASAGTLDQIALDDPRYLIAAALATGLPLP